MLSGVTGNGYRLFVCKRIQSGFHDERRTQSVLRGVTTLGTIRYLKHADHPRAPKSCNNGLLWEAPPRLRRSAVAQQTWWERTCPRMQYFSHCICVGCTGLFADKSAPQNRVSSVGYRLFDKSGLVRECSISATASASDVPVFSRTSPLPQNPVSSVGCRLFDKRRLAGDAFSEATYQ